jgi:hypothetical protein
MSLIYNRIFVVAAVLHLGTSLIRSESGVFEVALLCIRFAPGPRNLNQQGLRSKSLPLYRYNKIKKRSKTSKLDRKAERLVSRQSRYQIATF